MSTCPDLTAFDIILVNTSAGKDSQAMLDYVVELADAAGVRDRIVAVHADLGRVEWPGTAELAEEHAAHYGLRIERIARPQGDLLTHIEQRGMFPSSTARYCTSDHKRGQIRKVMTKLVAELALPRPARILNCMGLRAQESPARAKKEILRYDAPASGKGTVRQVTEWLPILHWSTEDVWARIAQAGTRAHPAYAEGMPRLSCCFCVLASRGALVRAAQLAPELAAEYAAVEVRIGHRFRNDLSMAQIIAEAAVSTAVVAEDWLAA
jgi:3'-phosphoadenosine 5'-phosphosulfate sulfotransferase (PAPS reductase)/FAD synthetase